MNARHLLVTGLAVSAAVVIALRPDLPAADPATAGPGTLVAAQAADASLLFEANQGQTDARVRFVSRGDGYTVFLTDEQAVLRLRQARSPASDTRDRPQAGPAAVVGLSLAGANPAPVVTGEDRAERTTHYLVGNDKAQWQRDVPSYAKVRYQGVYPGIDAVYYGHQGELEYDFVVAPGADPAVIEMAFSGVDGLRVDDAGNLLLDIGGDAMVQRKPVVYQMVDGARRMVDAAYDVLGTATVGFALGQFDASLPLVIDPVLSYSTYLGGDGIERAQAIAVDQAGNTWTAGVTDSVVFPWAMALDTEYGGGAGDAYVCRFRAAGGNPLCAYIGGSEYDEAFAVAIGPDGSVHVAGYTESWDFPVLYGQQQPPHIDPNGEGGLWGDAFVLKVNATADDLSWSTFLGGNSTDMVRAMAVDGDGSVYVTGSTWSYADDFPTTTGAFQAQDTEDQDAFVTKYDADGFVQYSTQLGGAGVDAGRGIVIGNHGRAYVSGHTTSSDFPTRNPLQAAQAGMGDAFIAVLNAAGSGMVYGTYLGGSGEDWGYELRLDGQERIHLAGFTYSADFPVADSLQAYAGDRDGFVARLSADGASMQFSSYLGGTGMDDLRHVQLDPAGNLYVAGYTTSEDFPLVDSLQARKGQDAVVMKIDASGRDVLFSTALGGSDFEVLGGLARDLDGTLHIPGWTASVDYPMAGAYQDVHVSPPTDDPEVGGTDTFLSRIADAALDSWRGDFNGDGTDDILWRNVATGQGAIWFSGNKGQAVNIARVTNLDWRIVGVGDFNGDGEDDILWRNPVTGANVIWRSGDSTESQSVVRITNTNWSVQGVGDFNADGFDDILWHDDTIGSTGIWYAADYAARVTLTRVTNLAWDIVGAGDFDGDGMDDILWRNTANGQNTVWKGANSRSTMPVARITGLAWQIVGIGDFQGDGMEDILWRNLDNGRNAIWKGASKPDQQAISRVTGQRWQVYGTGDYNGDGTDDILWRDGMLGGNTIWRSGNSGAVQKTANVRAMDWVIKS